MSAVPFVQTRERLQLQLFDQHDMAWIDTLLDEVARAVGRPWRELLERLDQQSPHASSASRRAAVIQSMRTLLAGRVPSALKGERVRRELFGVAALDAVARRKRVVGAAATLATTPDEIERMLWTDLPGERIVSLADGRPSPQAVAAEANVRMIQRALLRCHELRLRVSGDGREVLRAAAARGLLATARRIDDSVELAISGPLAVFHQTTVYGRALGGLVPILAQCERFALEARCDLGYGPGVLAIRSPVVLPAVTAPARHDQSVEARFTRDLARRSIAWHVRRESTVFDAGTHLVVPDLVLEHREDRERRWWVEIVGYWTAEFIARKLACYQAAGVAHVIFCIDGDRGLDGMEHPPHANIVRFHKRVPVDEVLAIIDRPTLSKPRERQTHDTSQRGAVRMRALDES